MSIATPIFPYSTPEKSGKQKFNANMELAAILCLAEARRKKHGVAGFPPEKISFISKLHYPLWAIPWEKESLLIDGMGALSPTLAYAILPDMERFLNDIERGQTYREQFHETLDEYFQNFAYFSEKADVPINAVLTDNRLLSEVSDYIQETLPSGVNLTGNTVLIPPRLDENAACEHAKKVSELYLRIQSDIKGLEYIARALQEITQFHAQKILHEIELTNEAFEMEFDRVKPVVDEKVDSLLEERDSRIEKVSRSAEAESNRQSREIGRFQRELDRLELRRNGYKTRLDVRKHGHTGGRTRWEQSLRICENRISEVKSRIHSLSAVIEKIRIQQQRDINNLKYEYQALIDIERKKLTDIEAFFESIRNAKQKETDRLELQTKRLIVLIDQWLEQKKLHAIGLKNLTIHFQTEKTTPMSVPFYLVGYKTDDRFHYLVYPPVKVMNSEGIVKRIEKTLFSFNLVARIKLLLQPRSKALNRMFSIVLEVKIKTDKTLEQSLLALARSNNLLKNSGFKETVTKGVRDLQTEGWIKDEEGSALLRAYAQEGLK